jgi:carbamate kinase
MIEVDRDDPAFQRPTKPIGPVLDRETAERLQAASGWSIAPDGDKFRRVVPSLKPKRIFEIRSIRSLVEQGMIVVCAGGGGILTMYDEHGKLHGVEAVIDKYLASALLAEQLDADLLVIATDVDGVYTGWGRPRKARLDRGTRDELARLDLPAGSMGPKVEAACGFARNTGREAVIGALTDIAEIVTGTAGTRVRAASSVLDVTAGAAGSSSQ